jgi:hypothetical protein
MNAKKLNAIKASISNDKIINKNIDKKLKYYTIDNFINDALCYIKAIQEKRMINVIKSVSTSGMSRVIKFTSCEKGNNKQYYQRNYNCLFIALDYTEAKHKDGFTIGGCGMDMIFHTNYSIIHKLHRLGFINKTECEKLAQMTPNTI